jgi:hypothetical protein
MDFPLSQKFNTFMEEMAKSCNVKIGDLVVLTPTQRVYRLYANFVSRDMDDMSVKDRHIMMSFKFTETKHSADGLSEIQIACFDGNNFFTCKEADAGQKVAHRIKKFSGTFKELDDTTCGWDETIAKNIFMQKICTEMVMPFFDVSIVTPVVARGVASPPGGASLLHHDSKQ